MFCKNCGKELPDNAKFCNGCGSPVAPAAPSDEGAVPPAEPAASFVPPAPAEEAGAPFTQSDPPVQQSPAAPDGGKRRGKSGMIVIGAGAVVVLLVVIGLFKLLSGLGGGGKTQAYAYLSDRGELMYLSDLKEKTEAVEVSDEVNEYASVQFSSNGKIIYFRDSNRTLYKIAVADLKKNGRPERVSRDVSWFRVLDTDNVLFAQTTGDAMAMDLNCYDGKEDYLVAKDYYVYQLSEDHKTVYYIERDEDDYTVTLYKVALKKDAQEEELLDGASNIYTDWDASLLVYSEMDPDGDKNNLTVYSCKPGGSPEELLDRVYGVYGVKTDGGKVSFYYTVADDEEYTLYDLVSDSMASQDAATTAEDLVRPNWYNEYYPESVSFDNGAWSYVDPLGGVHSIDSALLMERYPDTPLADLSEYLVRNVASEQARALYDQANEAYDAAYDEWSAATSRNRMREQLKEESYTQTSLSLYQYSGSADSDPIASEISTIQFYSFGENGVFLYQKAAGVTGGKVCDLSDLNRYSDVYDYLYSGSTDEDWYQNVGGVESVIDLGDDQVNLYNICVLNGKEVVLETSSTDSGRVLRAYSLDKTALTFIDELTDDFSGTSMGTDSKGNDVLYYFTDVGSDSNGTVGDFTRYAGGGKQEVLAKDVYDVAISEGSDSVYTVIDIDSRGRKELALMQDGKPVTISEEFTGEPIFLDAKQMLFLSDDELYLWNGKESRRVARDVSCVWASVSLDWTAYSPDGYY